MVQIKEKFLKRARAKYITKRFVLAMLEHNPDSVLKQSYLNTLYCNQSLHRVEDKIISTYCKNRWCLVCGRIRTANLINSYLSEFEKFSETYFVTLTLPTTPDLSVRMAEMEAEWRLISELARKLKINFRGVRKKECTLRPDNHYHYHYHIVVDGLEGVSWLVEQWLKRFPQANVKAQDIRKADERSYKELFKYFTKLVTTSREGRLIKEFERLDYVFRVLKGKRIFEPFGGVRKVDEDFNDVELKAQLAGLRGEVWRWAVSDWENEFGDLLCGYEPSEQLLELLRECPE